MTETTSTLWIVCWMLLLGSGLMITSMCLISLRKGDPKFIVSFALFGIVVLLSPFVSLKELSPTSAKFEPGGIYTSTFKDADNKPKISITDTVPSTAFGPAQNLIGREVLVAYRTVRLDDAKILVELLKAAKLTPILADDPLTSTRINIQYPTGIVRIVYKNKEDRQFVGRILDIIQYYRSNPEAEIAIGGPYQEQIKGRPVQILLY